MSHQKQGKSIEVEKDDHWKVRGQCNFYLGGHAVIALGKKYQSLLI
jgi:hypothetical protein